MFGHLKINVVASNEAHQIIIYFHNLFLSDKFPCALSLFIIILTIPMTTTINHIRNIYFPDDGVIISGAFAICIIPMNPTVIIPNPMAMILSIHSPTSNNPNNAISINAVCLAINARANITHEMMIYFKESQ